MALRRITAFAAGTAAVLSLSVAPAAAATSANPLACSPAVTALGYSDALDKAEHKGVEIGGLSSLAFDPRSRAWASTVDNHGGDPARIWFYANLSHPVVTRDPLVLRKPGGAPYDGTTADNEGLAVLPNGDYVVTSEVEPSIRIFGRDGVQKASLPVPARFAVTASGGQATSNATFEGLTALNSGRRLVVSMEGALSGDVSATGDDTLHRFLVYSVDPAGQWRLTKQVAYRTGPGMRVPEIAAYGEDSLVVEEAAFSTTAGNAVDLFTVRGLDGAADVSSVGNLSTAPARDVLPKRRLASLVNCPTLGATAGETQTNPLLDNFEGMVVTGGPGLAGIDLISDDNFGATQTTRVLAPRRPAAMTRPGEELLVGIDIGTTAVKVAAFTVDGRQAGAHTEAYPITRPRPGWAEQDPLDWWRGCVAGLRAVLAGVGAVRAIGIVSQVNSHLLVDDRLQPLTPAVIWQDLRAADLARELDARFTLEDKMRIWGGPVALDASFVGARAAWFSREQPENWARARWVLSPKDFIGAKLTGRVATDPLSGVRVAGAAGYLPEAVALVDGLAERLPEILEPEAQLGVAGAFGGAPVVVGTMDAFGVVFALAGTDLFDAPATTSERVARAPPRRRLRAGACRKPRSTNGPRRPRLASGPACTNSPPRGGNVTIPGPARRSRDAA